MKIKDYIKQFYTEGFATTFYQKPIKFINRKIKNKFISKYIILFITILYTLIFISIAIIYLYNKLK
jgi:hypothetical protein